MSNTDRLQAKPVTIAVDFDGVLHKYSKGWHDGTIYDEPMAGAKEALEYFKAQGFSIVIHSARACDRVVDVQARFLDAPGQAKLIEEWLDLHNIPYDIIWTGQGKPIAYLYIDDRAIQHINWKLTLAAANDKLKRFLDEPSDFESPVGTTKLGRE